MWLLNTYWVLQFEYRSASIRDQFNFADPEKTKMNASLITYDLACIRSHCFGNIKIPDTIKINIVGKCMLNW